MPDASDRLRYNVLCETLTEQQFQALERQCVPRSYVAGDVILEEDSEGEELFFIVSGRVKIAKQAKEGREMLLAILHAGDFFGELELVDSRPRSARVIALDNCVVYALRREKFDALLDSSLPFTFRLLQVLSVRLRALNKHFLKEIEISNRQNRKELQKLERLIEASRTLNSTLHLDTLLGLILDTALKIVDGDRGTVYLVDEERREIWSMVLKGDERIEIRLPMGKGIAGYVAATGDTLNIRDAYDDPRFNPDIDRMSGYHTESILCMPMKNNSGKIIGVFQLLNKHDGVFSEEDESFIDALSIHAAIAVENARLYEGEKRKIIMEKDLLAAREVQMSMVPKQLPEFPGYEFAAVTLPAREVGGDLYDFIPEEYGRLAITLGDVSGKGLAASLLMANLQATLRSQASTGCNPSDCLRKANRLMHQTTASDRFITLFYGVLNPKSGEIVYANAGHEPPSLIRPSGEIVSLDCSGVVLGILEDFPYEHQAVLMEPGDVFVVISDGISEATNTEGEMFGKERLEQVVLDHRQESAAEIAREIIGTVEQYAAGAHQIDDITLVVAKRTNS